MYQDIQVLSRILGHLGDNDVKVLAYQDIQGLSRILGHPNTRT